MKQEWGKQLKKFRLRTGLSQHEFSDAISIEMAQLNEETRAKLKDHNIENIILSNSEISRYETGKRIPRFRSRLISLIFILVRLNGINSLEEANTWLEQADQAPLTEKEIDIVFDSQDHNKKAGLNKTLSKTLTEQPVGLTMPQFAMWSSLLAIVIILLGVIYFLQSDRAPQTEPLTESRSESSKITSSEQQEGSENNVSLPEEEASSKTDMENLYLIGDFSNGIEGWMSFQNEENMHEFSVETEALCTDIASAGPYFLDLRFWRDQVPVLANTQYKLSMDVKSTADRNITLILANQDFNKWYLFTVEEVKVGEQTLEIEFSQQIADPVASFSLFLGGQAPGELCFDNIEIEQIGTFKDSADPPQQTADNMLQVEPFAKGWLENWLLHVFQEPVYTIHFKEQSVCFLIDKYVDYLGQINFRQEEIDLAAGASYQISFDATASVKDQISVNIKLGESVDEVWTLTEGNQLITHSFQSDIDQADQTFLVHLSGPDGSEVCFSDIALVPKN